MVDSDISHKRSRYLRSPISSKEIKLGLSFHNFCIWFLLICILGFAIPIFNTIFLGEIGRGLINQSLKNFSDVLMFSLTFLVLAIFAGFCVCVLALLECCLICISNNACRCIYWAITTTGIVSGVITLLSYQNYLKETGKSKFNYQQDISNGIIQPLIIIFVQVISILIARQAWKGNPQFNQLKNWAIRCGAIGGTSFYGMDLTRAVFDGYDLRNTDLRAESLTHASFVGAKNLDLALVKGTILEDARVRNLLVNPNNPRYQDFTGANFQGASLRGANLKGANLTCVNAINTDFTGADLNNVCIQDWNISKDTKFTGVQCRRVFLKQNQQEPKPDSGEFKEGEFEKWVTELQDTIDLIFQKGLSLRSLAYAITQVGIDHEETELTLESIAHKGDEVVVVKVGIRGKFNNTEINKAEIHAVITNEYNKAQQAISAGHELVLRAKNDQIESLKFQLYSQEKHIQGLISCIAQPREPFIIDQRIYHLKGGDVVEGQKMQAGGNIEQGNRIIAGGDFTATGSTINLGDLSGEVTSSIQQLQDIQTSSSQELVKILAVLQSAIQDEQLLPDPLKVVSLQNLQTISEEAKKEPKQRSESVLSQAVGFLSGIGKMIGDTSKLAELCNTHLPTVMKFFSL